VSSLQWQDEDPATIVKILKHLGCRRARHREVQHVIWASTIQVDINTAKPHKQDKKRAPFTTCGNEPAWLGEMGVRYLTNNHLKLSIVKSF